MILILLSFIRHVHHPQFDLLLLNPSPVWERVGVRAYRQPHPIDSFCL
jgi:hypothetical protein